MVLFLLLWEALQAPQVYVAVHLGLSPPLLLGVEVGVLLQNARAPVAWKVRHMPPS